MICGLVQVCKSINVGDNAKCTVLDTSSAFYFNDYSDAMDWYDQQIQTMKPTLDATKQMEWKEFHGKIDTVVEQLNESGERKSLMALVHNTDDTLCGDDETISQSVLYNVNPSYSFMGMGTFKWQFEPTMMVTLVQMDSGKHNNNKKRKLQYALVQDSDDEISNTKQQDGDDDDVECSDSSSASFGVEPPNNADNISESIESTEEEIINGPADYDDDM